MAPASVALLPTSVPSERRTIAPVESFARRRTASDVSMASKMWVPYATVGGCASARSRELAAGVNARRTRTEPLKVIRPICSFCPRWETNVRAAASASAYGPPFMLSLASTARTTPKRSPLAESGETVTSPMPMPFSES